MGGGNRDLAAHHLPVDVRVGVVLAGVVVTILAHRVMRCKLLEPYIVVVMQAGSIAETMGRPFLRAYSPR